MSGKGKNKNSARYKKIKDHAIGVIETIGFSASPSRSLANSDSASPFTVTDIAKFMHVPPSEALDLKKEADKNPMQMQELRDAHRVWKQEQDEKITAFSEKITRNFQAELKRLLSSHHLKNKDELKTNKASAEVNGRYLDLESILIRLPDYTNKCLNDRIVSYKEYKNKIALYLSREIPKKEALDKHHGNCGAKSAVKITNLLLASSIVLPFFKKCATGSYFFSSTGKTKEVVEAAYEAAVTDETKRCCG